MCEPSTIMAGTAVVGMGLSIADKMSQRGGAIANRQAAINTALNETIPSINQSLAQSYNSNELRSNQEGDKAAVEKFDILRGMTEAKGAATAAAGDAGVGGVSFANILSDFETREGMAKGNIDYNLAGKQQQIADDNAANERKAQGAINTTINNAVVGTPVGSEIGMWAGVGAEAAKAGLTIGDKTNLFGKKVDGATGVSIDSEIAQWSKY